MRHPPTMPRDPELGAELLQMAEEDQRVRSPDTMGRTYAPGGARQMVTVDHNPFRLGRPADDGAEHLDGPREGGRALNVLIRSIEDGRFHPRT